MTNVLAAPPSRQRPFATMGKRAAYCQEREAQTNHLHWCNHQHRLHYVNPSLMGTWMEESREDPISLGSPYWGYLCPTSGNLDKGSDGGTATCQPNTAPSPQSFCIWTRSLLSCKSKAVYDVCQRCGMLTRLHLLKIRLIKS